MTEVNWAAHASIADTSSESANGANGAENLLRAREDALWLAGEAPQHVTLALPPHHPPLHYAGWHVWLDSPTNPRVVEIESGPTVEQLRPLLVCEALPGAGTQVWRLPRAIPPAHAFVRFSILESFGHGPTYMNTVVLLENDPGPDYNASGEAPPTTSVSLTPANPQYANDKADRTSPLPRRVTPPAGPPEPPAGINVSANSRGGRYADDGARSDVGVFVTTTGSATRDGPLQPRAGASRGRSSRTRSPRERSHSRMSQLLRDLDDDIKLLKPIKTLSPGKNMLMYLPPEKAELPMDSLPGSDSERDDRSPDRKPLQGRGLRRQSAEEDANGAPRIPQSSSAAASEAAGPRSHPRHHPHHHLQPSPMEYALYPAAEAYAGQQHAVHEARLNALERAVAALNEAVQHQRDDLTMIKRLLLQHAAERRKEADQRFEERQRYERMFSAVTGAMVVPSVSPPPPPPPPPAAPVVMAPGNLGDQRVTHRSITVDFPEDALRVFVESVLDQRMRKHTKKLEAKLLHRLDKQLHDVIKVLSATVEGQLTNVANAAAGAAGPSMSTPRSMYTEHVNAANLSGQVYSPMSHSSFADGTPHQDCSGDHAHFSAQRGGPTSLMSSKGDVSHTPHSAAEMGVSGFRPVGGAARVRGTS